MFTVIGRLRGGSDRIVAIQWDEGTLSGDETLVAQIEAIAAASEGRSVGPVEGPRTLAHHLDDPLSALFLIVPYFESPSTSGNVPQRPAIPEGATG